MTARKLLDLDGILTDIRGHSAELPVDVVDCVGCHIAVTDVPALVAEVRALRRDLAACEGSEDARLAIAEAEVKQLRQAVKQLTDYRNVVVGERVALAALLTDVRRLANSAVGVVTVGELRSVLGVPLTAETRPVVSGLGEQS